MIKFFYTKKQKKFILLYNKQQRGFSLIELMVVVVILGLITLGLVTFFMGGTKSWVAGQSQLEAQRNARQAMDRMVREIREADHIENSSTSTSIDFHTPFSGSIISYSLLDSDLKRGINLVISNVQSLSFTYFDSSGNSVAPENASKVHVLLEVDVDKDNNPDITLNTDVNLRNFGL
ncbi:prepilin-type N-terminal cleavage/methylation domain-containing protein [bacterium]|nr:prepilin-type N-terminal cleavage/methylation domain-containing protein [bacterium]